MNKKGYTLIEIIAVLAILSIIFSTGYCGYKYFRNKKIELSVNQELYEVEETLSYGLSYCASKKIKGEFVIRDYGNYMRVIFKENAGEVIKSTKLDGVLGLKNISYYPVERVLEINGDGYITSDTITLESKESGKEYELKTAVGVTTISIGNWDIYE